MKGTFYNFFVPIQLFFLLYWFVSQQAFPLVIGEVILLLFIIVDKLGKGIVLREVIAFHASIIILLMPEIGYRYYTDGHHLSRLWIKYMQVPSDIYFSYTIPAILLFNLALCWPLSNRKTSDVGYYFLTRFNQIKHQLQDSTVDGRYLILFGTGFYIINSLLPVSFQYIGFLVFISSFTGALLIFYKPNVQYRSLVLSFFILFLAYVTLASGMFTIVVYMGMTIFSFVFLGSNTSFIKKVSIIILIGFTLLIIQNIKAIYRSQISEGGYNNITNFGTLFVEEATSDDNFFSIDKFFFIYTRTNEGFVVSQVMDYIPRAKNYDNGEFLLLGFISSLVPRFLWQDKPMAGGRVSMQYFAGIQLEGRTSMNVSPVGEAYGSFGPYLGCIYLMLLGFFIRWIYGLIFSISNKFPFLIFWIPVFFFQVTYSMETDSLQIFNSLFKSIAFVIIMYYAFPTYFKNA